MAKQKTIIMTGYSRVSTKADSQRTSFEQQPAIFKTLLSLPEYSHYKPTKEFYCDFGVSGTKLNRPGFKKMLEDAGLDVEIIDKKKIPHPEYPDKLMNQRIYQVSVNPYQKPLFEEIWIKNTSRFARNINGYQIIQTLRLAGVYVYFIDLDLSSRNESDLPAIRKRLDEDMAYSEQNSRNRKIVQLQYERENRLSGCPYGYIYHNKTKTTDPYYELHPKESEVVKKIFQYCIEGLGAVAIGKRLAEEGHFTRHGKPFAESTIKKILDNEKYMGLNTSGKYTTGPLFEKLGSAKVRDDYQERLRENRGLPAIVTPDIWEQAHTAAKSRKTQPDSPKGKKPTKHPFKDLLTCKYCGSHFVYDNNGGRGFFKCATKANHGITACNCNNLFQYKLDEFIKQLQEEELYATIKGDYEHTIISLLTLINAYMEKYTNFESYTEDSSEYKELQEQLVILQEQRATIMEFFLSDKASKSGKEMFKKDISEIEEKIADIELQQEDLLTSKETILQTLEKLFSVVFEQFTQLETKKKTYPREEVLEKLSCIKVAGLTKNNSGGQPPLPMLFPLLKSTETAQGLISMGYKEFKYKVRIADPFYEVPGEYLQNKDGIHPWDDETLTVEQKKALLPRITKKDWFFANSKFLLFNNIYIAEDLGLGYSLDLGVEQEPVHQQLKEYAKSLYQKFLSMR